MSDKDLGALPPPEDRATHERSPQAVSAVPVGIPSAEDERAVVVAWLRYRADMASDLPPLWQPLKRWRWRWMAATFAATAKLVERRAHHAPDSEAETAIIRAAQAIETRRAETVGLGAKHESAVAESDAPETPSTDTPSSGGGDG